MRMRKSQIVEQDKKEIRNLSTASTDPKIGNNGTRVILIIKSIDKKRFIVNTILNGLYCLIQDFFNGIPKHLIHMLLLANLVEKCTQRLHSFEFTLNTDRIM